MRKRERYKWALMLESFSMGQTQQAFKGVLYGAHLVSVMIWETASYAGI